MASESPGASLIERYLCARGRRYFRGRHDGEFFYVFSPGWPPGFSPVTDTRPRRLHVHLEVCPTDPDVLVVRVTPASFFPASQRRRLTDVAEAWNSQKHDVVAIVHESLDPERVGVVGRGSQWLSQNVSFEDFASRIDATISDAVDLFGRLTAITGCAPGEPTPLRDAG